ncbi:putative ABC transporter permease [Hominiventricola aquisgranensis]|uniref:ABC transporter permease n=1 Tax=Hominiventricola aquisgranensis TaxID=3133164 RepID=A0ABV1HWP7_9FIRM
MIYNTYELIWLFLIYSFLGWMLETILAATEQRRFVNRGLINGPLCTIYGVPIVILTIFGQELPLFWLFLGAMIVATVTEWISGHMIERFYHERWWDYSNVKWNLDGYICLPASLVWGVLGTISMRWGNGLLIRLYGFLPEGIGHLLVWILAGMLVLDVTATIFALSGIGRSTQKWEAVDSWFTSISLRIGQWLYGHVDRRIHRAYPKTVRVEKPQRDKTVFAAGCCMQKLVWLFFIGCLLGDITETIFCRITAGVWMSRSSLVWGPFSIVWGFAIAAVTDLLYKYKDRSDRFLFLMGTALGGAYEYLCSVLSEMVFGTVFWDYSEIPFNLGGRINLLYCFFWGFAAVAWFKIFYPVISGWIEKLPICAGRILTWVIVVFMCCNMAVSTMALIRSNERSQGIPATQSWQQTMDERFPDERMEKIYPNAIKVGMQVDNKRRTDGWK